MSNLKGKKAVIDDREFTEIIINDIREMDSDVYAGLVEYMYPVKAEYEDGLITLEPTDENQNLEDIF